MRRNIASLKHRVGELIAAKRPTVEMLMAEPLSNLTPEELDRIVAHLESKVERLGGIEYLTTDELHWFLAHERGDDRNTYSDEDLVELCDEYDVDATVFESAILVNEND